VHNLKFADRSLWRARGLSATVTVTLALGIGANAAIFSLVRAVLLRPLVNRDESRLLYLRQSAPGIGLANATFSVPEIHDLRERVKSLTAIGEFSTVGFTMVGAGEPRQVRAGVVSGNYFEVMGLRPVLGRLLNSADDGPGAAAAAVLTYRFWTTTFQRDPTILGKAIRLDTRSAVIVGVLEPSVPYPAETELIANMVTSPHHLSATMITGREHRMTETFGRLAPSASLESARTELRQVHGTLIREHAEAYPPRAAFAINVVRLRDELTARARTLLIVLMAASILVFVIACSNVANLLLARTVRRESEFAVRVALGADNRSLRRTLLVESLLLCGSGAILGVTLAASMVSILARYASRFSARALDVELDVPFLAIAIILAAIAAVLLAYVPRLPSGDRPGGLKLTSGSLRISGAIRRRLNLFAITQIGASFVLLAGAAMLLQTFLALQAASPGFATSRVLAINVPVTSYGRTGAEIREFYRQVQSRIGALPGVDRVAVGSMVPWRDRGGGGGSGLGFQIEGGTRGGPGDDPRARFRSVSPGFFASLGVPVSAGRDFAADDVDGGERVVIVSQSVADRLFPGRQVINRHLLWTDRVMKFIGVSAEPRRIIGVVPDIDDERIVPGPALTVYHPFEQEVAGGRVFVHTGVDPYSLVPNITRIVRELASDQPVEQAATLDDVRAEVLAPDRLNSLVFGIFAAVAVAISVVGVAGVLAFSVSGRLHEFGIRLAIGARPSAILGGVLKSGVLIAAAGIAAGAIAGFVVARLAAGFLQQTQWPGIVPIAAAAALLLIAALIASVIPAARAAGVDVIRALRTE
jgi:putative ABC transport system permease protein